MMNPSGDWIIGRVSEHLHEVSHYAIDILSTMGEEAGACAEALRKNIEEMDQKKLLRVAFIGQYSAGKSTLISALTGKRDIHIDADIATDKATDYAWNGILLTDTPGLYTDRKDHDAVTLKAIHQADLLVFAITSDLFDDVILGNFKKLAYEEAFKPKVLLVVNKMSMESGHYDILVDNYRETLRESLLPYDINDFEISFIDAADYIEGTDDDVPELLEMSHFGDFVDQLNQFIENKHLLGKLDRPVRFAISELQKAALLLSDTEANRASNVIFNRVEDRIKKSMSRSDQHIDNQISLLQSNILDIGNQVSAAIGDSESDVTVIQVRTEQQIREVIQRATRAIQNMLEEQQSELRQEVDAVFDSDAGRAYIREVQVRELDIQDPTAQDSDDLIKGFRTLTNVVNGVGSGVFQTLGGVKSGFYQAADVAGSTLHKSVYAVGRFFGADFEPWKAVNIAKTIGNVFKVLGVVATIGSAVLDVISIFNDDDKAKRLIESKRNCVASFSQMASDVAAQVREGYQIYCKEFYYPLLNDISEERKRQMGSQKLQSETQKQLAVWYEELRELLREIESEARVPAMTRQ